METKRIIKLGTKVTITKNISNHPFKIGEQCVCSAIHGNTYQFINIDRLCGCMESSEFEIIVPEKPSRKTDNSEKPNKAK